MRLGLLFGIVTAASLLAAPGAHAFTMEGNSSAAGSYVAPQFDLEEQMRQFRNSGTTLPSTGKNQFSTPFGNGTFEMSVRPSNGFNSAGSGWNSNTGPTRQDYNRM